MKDMAHPAQRLPLRRLAYRVTEAAVFVATLAVLGWLVLAYGAPLK